MTLLVAAREGSKSPRVIKALRAEIKRAGLDLNEVARRISSRGQPGDSRSLIQKHLAGTTAVSIPSARRYERVLGSRAGAIENVVRAEALRAEEAKVQARIRAGQADLRSLRESRRKLS